MKKIASLLLISCIGCATVESTQGIKKDDVIICAGDAYQYSHQWERQKFHDIPIDTIFVVSVNGKYTKIIRQNGLIMHVETEMLKKDGRLIPQ